MRGRVAVLLCVSALTALAQSSNFVWDYSGLAPRSPFNYGYNYGWVVNGAGNFGSASGASNVWPATVSGTNPNDYEINTPLLVNSGGGTYMHFLRAATTVLPGSGSYISVELAVPSNWQPGGTVPLAVNQCVNGTVTQLASTSVPLHSGDVLRSIVFGTNLWIFINNFQYGTFTIPQTSGQPGYGGYNIPSGSGFPSWPAVAVQVGHHDTVPPQGLAQSTVATSLLPYSVSLKWPTVPDDSVGIGVFEYLVSRNGLARATLFEPEFGDSAVQPSTTYTYSVQAIDEHGNTGAAATVTVTTPPAGAVDPRRVGLYSTGSYWGGGGEQIDTLSGNLHFSVPLLTAQGRTGWTVPVSMVYDSQNWRQDNGVNWQLGTDVGYGFGWKMLIGSITPYYTSYWSGVDHYVYTDSTGAQYRLDQHNNGVWTSSAQSVYVWLDTTVSPNKLHFRDGTFWVMGCTSGGMEQDAGTLYPTIIEDRFGNQVIVTYDTAAGLSYAVGTNGLLTVYTANTSSRILVIGDVRAVGFGFGGATVATYSFGYDHQDYAIPHLTMFGNEVGTSERGGPFTYTSVTQEPPFGTDANYGAPVELLTKMQIGPLQPYQFTYDTTGAGELASVIFPYGGEISWNYSSFQYIGSRTLREVGGRFVAPDYQHATNPPWSYGISRPDAANSVTVHSAMTLTDASGIGAKTWTFNTGGGAAWQIGLASRYTQLASVGGAILHDDYYTWSQDPAGHPYISADTSISDEGTGNQQSALSTQTLDQYGNVTQAVTYPYNNTTTPLKTYNNTYITSSNYTSSYIYNLLSASTLTMGGTNATLITNYYDYTACKPGPFGGSACGGNAGGTAPTAEYDANSPVPAAYKGILSVSVTPTKATGTYYYSYGGVSSVAATDGTTATASASAATNYAAPQSISVQNYSQTVSYNAWLGMTSQTGANGEQLAMAYDSYGRPSTGTSPYGAVTYYSYGTTAPFTQTETGPSGVTITTVDGFGRAVLVASGDTSGVHSYTATVYSPCACSPLGKQSQASQPYPSGSASAWTTWTYDGLGRTVSVRQPDGASTTHYAYSGNQSTVTDPAGKWKQFTKDVLGNLTTVVEPDPANQPGGMLTTSYTYDWMGHVTQVSMPRGSTTQTRTFVYDTAGRLTSATNPENGTVTYTYNSDNTLNKKVDAKGQQTTYTYDSMKRVTQTQRYFSGNVLDTCGTVTYAYDTNPVNSSFSQYSQGRLTTVQYSAPNSNIPLGSYIGNGNGGWTTYSCTGDTYTEMYSYHPAGAVTAKNLQFLRTSYPNGYLRTGTASVEVDYAYDSAGRAASVTYPFNLNSYAPHTLSYAYDSMGRPVSLTDNQDDTGAGVLTAVVQGVQYDFAGRLSSLQQFTGTDTNYSPYVNNIYAQETRSYTVNGQLGSQSWNPCEISCSSYSNPSPPAIQYSYSTTQNNGQITQAVDAISGETISYQYDALKRLTSAAATPIHGSYPAAWTQTFQYDGFGNLTAKVLNGATTPIAVNAASNRLTNAYYDANGNMTSGAGATLGYDEANRLVSAAETSGGQETYGYDPANKRIYRMDASGNEHFTFYGAKGEKLGTYGISSGPNYVCVYNPYTCTWQYTVTPQSTSIWFAGKMIWDSGAAVIQDRLGSNRGSSLSYYGLSPGAQFYPYGEEITSTSNDRMKFATYTRDAYTGLDYADQRFYASSYGRFNTADQYAASAGPGDPGSWNRYSYTRGDPVNRRDPRGTCDEDTETSVYVCDSVDTAPFPGSDGGGNAPTVVTPYSIAVGRLADAAFAFENRTSFSANCQRDIDAIAWAAPSYVDSSTITIDALQEAANQTAVANGAGSQISQSVLYPTAPQAASSVAGLTIGSLFSNPAQLVTAVTALGGNTIYINPSAVSGSLSVNEGLLMHELLHELGLQDADIGKGLSLIDPSIQPDKKGDWTNTRQFSDKLTADCFTGKDNKY